MVLVVNLLDEFISTFGYMSLTSYCLLFIGLVLIICEIFQPSKGLLNIVGGALLVLCIVLRYLQDFNFAHVFILIFFISIVILATYFLLIVTSKKKWLIKASTLARQPMVSDERESSFAYLIDLEGITTTKLSPFGHMTINDTTFFVTSNSGIIEVGARVKVLEVDNSYIIVDKIV